VYGLPPAVEAWIDAYNARNAAAANHLRQAQTAQPLDLAAAQAALAEATAVWQTALADIAASQGAFRAGWYFAYRLAYEAVRGEGHRAAEQAALTAWKTTIAQVLADLHRLLWAALAAALPAEVRQVLFIPSGPLALLPVHAAAPADLAVAYAPALTVWQQCQERARAAQGLFLTTPAADLSFAQAEAGWLAERMAGLNQPVTWLNQSQATVANITAQAAGHGIVHFAGHAGYNWNQPLASALACVDGPLTLSEIRQQMDLRLARLVVLSACATGMSDVLASGEEFVGLPAALLEMGAPAVVASLWPVHDVSTAFLLDRFYNLWLGDAGLTIAQALAAAAHWLRTASKADLLARIAASKLSDDSRALVERALEQVLRLELTRMADATGLAATDAILSKSDQHPPFAAPYYWAAFAAYGAAL